MTMTRPDVTQVQAPGSTWPPTPTPTGTVAMWATGTPPTGWLLADGTEVSRTVYAALFAVIGTTFGSGSLTTFTLPNFTDRLPVGSGSNYGLGATGGSANAIVVSHTHTFTGNALAAHSHKPVNGASMGLSPGGGGGLGGGDLNSAGGNVDTSSVSAGTPSGTNSETGSAGTNANMPPYLGIRFIIKT